MEPSSSRSPVVVVFAYPRERMDCVNVMNTLLFPFDNQRYDEDCPMELVTPKGWTPTPLGRAGRRQIKPVNTFTPSSEVREHRAGPLIPSVVARVPSSGFCISSSHRINQSWTTSSRMVGRATQVECGWAHHAIDAS